MCVWHGARWKPCVDDLDGGRVRRHVTSRVFLLWYSSVCSDECHAACLSIAYPCVLVGEAVQMSSHKISQLPPGGKGGRPAEQTNRDPCP